SALKKFWTDNSDSIIKALKNLGSIVSSIFSTILKVIQFVMPFVLGIIKSVWSNIKGVIEGALKVIMGAIKLFAGILTLDFSKMWEGIKQIFFGAIQFVWNFIQLQFIGRILKGVGGFASNLVSLLKGGWDKAINGIKTFVGTAKSWFED